MEYNKIYGNVKELHKINFTEILSINNYDDDFSLTEKYYDFSENGKYNNGHFKGKIENCCHKCDGFDSIRDDDDVTKEEYEKYKNYRLENVSHGSHTIDYLNAAGFNKFDIDELFNNGSWDDTPVLFLMENPSVDYEIYHKVGNKYPTRTWYWIHRKLIKPDDMIQKVDDYLVQGEYGQMVYALICKYKLANAYLTNVIKCGMNNKSDFDFEKEGYLGTWWYRDDCKSTCIKEILSKEIHTLRNGYNKIKVFAFGSNAYWLAKDYFQNSSSYALENLEIQLVQLPHPSSRISNNYRKYVVKGILNDVLNSKKFSLSKKELPTKERVKKRLEKEFKEINIKLTESWGTDKLTVKYSLENSLFNEEQNENRIVKEIILKGRKNNNILGNIEMGYNFVDEVYWGWDINKKDYISIDKIKYFETFKKVIESI